MRIAVLGISKSTMSFLIKVYANGSFICLNQLQKLKGTT